MFASELIVATPEIHFCVCVCVPARARLCVCVYINMCVYEGV